MKPKYSDKKYDSIVNTYYCNLLYECIVIVLKRSRVYFLRVFGFIF